MLTISYYDLGFYGRSAAEAVATLIDHGVVAVVVATTDERRKWKFPEAGDFMSLWADAVERRKRRHGHATAANARRRPLIMFPSL